MREALIILPAFFPNSERRTRQAREFAELSLAYSFGGFTKQKAWGSDPTTQQGEQVWIYTVAMDPTHDNDALLAQIAFRAWHETGQAFGYIRLASGDVSIVDIAKAQETGIIPLPSGPVPLSATSSVTTTGLKAA